MHLGDSFNRRVRTGKLYNKRECVEIVVFNWKCDLCAKSSCEMNDTETTNVGNTSKSNLLDA
jgi:hypothetical protein